MLPSLTEIANHYGTDKGTSGPSSRWDVHNYTDIYEAYLHPYRHEPIALLEIGLGVTRTRWKSHIVHGRNAGGGASPKTWYDYFSRARIFGIDVNACAYLDNDRIMTYVADQGNPAELDAFMQAAGHPQFDVIIDDGSHWPDHQQISLGYFFKYLKPGGWYFVEDLLTNGLHDRAGQGGRRPARVVSTRAMLRSFLAGRGFAQPNALPDAAYLAEQIDWLRLQLPQPGRKWTISRDPRHPLKTITYYKPDSEALAVIRKK